MNWLSDSGMRFHDYRCLLSFAWMLVGLFLEKGVHLSKWCTHRPGQALAASKQRQFTRWLHNPNIQPTALYHQLLIPALARYSEPTLYIALDTTSLWGRFVLIRLALIYRGRALPLSWRLLAHPSTTVAFADYRIVLQETAALLPPHCHIILLADRGFYDHELMCLMRNLNWGFRLRLKGSFLVQRQGQTISDIARLLPPPGQTRFLPYVWLTAKSFGPVHLALATIKTNKSLVPWVVLSDDLPSLETFREYSLRFDMEENFLDDKSAGFQLESSELNEAQALSRLALLLATATLYLVSSGVAVVSNGCRRLVDSHWQRGLSYLQIGWRWLRYALANGLQLYATCSLEPGPDPCPAIAAKDCLPKSAIIIATLATHST